ncbi:hypothetical protein [Hyphomicrobium sp.]|uniref:hypothetical protein n=1 Tax=Hyphomicrobium sp. TaxID=82 RepID=UPI0025BC8C3E|nr:hypothetical protein [Hyphomicrobium sp.]
MASFPFSAIAILVASLQFFKQGIIYPIEAPTVKLRKAAVAAKTAVAPGDGSGPLAAITTQLTSGAVQFTSHP